MPAEDEVLDQGTTDEGVVDGESQDDQSTSGDSGSGDEDFLVVDERTKYKTREDAVKAYQSAGQRISQLSAWDKEVGQAFNVSDPRQVAAALREYLEMKEAAKAAAGQGKTGTQATRSNDATELSKEEQDALKWLEKVSDRLGYVPKAEFEKVMDRLNKLEGGLTAQDEANQARQVEQGRGQLVSLLTEAKLPANEEFTNFMEQSITNWVNSDKGRIERWQAGGKSAEALVKEGFDWAKKVLTQVQRPATANYQEKKQNATQSRPKTLPQAGGTPNKRSAQPGKPEGITSEMHKRAWELLQSRIGGATREE